MLWASASSIVIPLCFSFATLHFFIIYVHFLPPSVVSSFCLDSTTMSMDLAMLSSLCPVFLTCLWVLQVAVTRITINLRLRYRSWRCIQGSACRGGIYEGKPWVVAVTWLSLKQQSLKSIRPFGAIQNTDRADGEINGASKKYQWKIKECSVRHWRIYIPIQSWKT